MKSHQYKVQDYKPASNKDFKKENKKKIQGSICYSKFSKRENFAKRTPGKAKIDKVTSELVTFFLSVNWRETTATNYKRTGLTTTRTTSGQGLVTTRLHKHVVGSNNYRLLNGH